MRAQVQRAVRVSGRLARLAGRGTVHGAALVAGIVSAALTWFVVAALIGIGLIIGGVNMLFGEGWALIAGGVACLAAAWLMAKGLTNG